MTDHTARRQYYIPAGALKIADKQSSAVACLYTSKTGAPAAVLFSGRRGKPDGRFRYGSESRRANAVEQHFINIRASENRRAKRREEAKKAAAKGQGVQVGHIFVSTWGYEQTNVDFFEVTALVGKTMVEVRKVASMDADHGTAAAHWSGQCVPCPGEYIGEPTRHRVNRANGYPSIRIESYATAFLWEGRPVYYSTYA